MEQVESLKCSENDVGSFQSEVSIKCSKIGFALFSFFKIGMIAKILFCFKQFLRPLTLIKLRNKYKFYIFWTLNPLISNENF